MQERRHSGRWEINSRANVKICNQTQLFNCTIDDINFKGLRLRFPQSINMNNAAEMHIALGDELFLNIEAAVAWNKADDTDTVYGLFFTRIKDSDKESIYKFIQKNFAEKIKQQVYRDLV